MEERELNIKTMLAAADRLGPSARFSAQLVAEQIRRDHPPPKEEKKP